MPRRILLVAVLSVFCLLAGKITKANAAEPVDLSGKWHGTWVSCQTGHHGTLTARFHKIGEDCYQVRFSGTFFVAVPFTFVVKLHVTGQEDGKIFLSGAPHLPLFGTFNFSASSTNGDFTATYSARNDEGRFTLSR